MDREEIMRCCEAFGKRRPVRNALRAVYADDPYIEQISSTDLLSE
jgi:hypothetical protein